MTVHGTLGRRAGIETIRRRVGDPGRFTASVFARALGTTTPPVRVEMIAVADMRRRFGGWQGYFTAVRAPEPTIFLTHDASRAVHVHEVSRAVLFHAGKSLRPDLDHKARRACRGAP